MVETVERVEQERMKVQQEQAQAIKDLMVLLVLLHLAHQVVVVVLVQQGLHQLGNRVETVATDLVTFYAQVLLKVVRAVAVEVVIIAVLQVVLGKRVVVTEA
jgi:hypothetical protein